VDFHEDGFRSQLGGVNAQRQGEGVWFELDGEQREQAEGPNGPANPQALNRYAYGLNTPVKYTDPTGHYGADGVLTAGAGGGTQVPPVTPGQAAKVICAIICTVIGVEAGNELAQPPASTTQHDQLSQ
jgi:hypothetical protein